MLYPATHQILNNSEAQAIEREEGQSATENYINEVFEQAQIRLPQLLQDQLEFGFTHNSRQQYRQKYEQLRESINVSSSDLVDIEVAKASHSTDSDPREAAKVVAQERFARRVAYQYGTEIWKGYVNETVRQACQEIASTQMYESDEYDRQL